MLNPKAWEGDSAVLDDWNDEICKRLDACVKVLRNAYIDSVGTTFEQPEDFGTLPIGKLLRKYNKAINKVLGIVAPKKEKEVPQLDMNPNVGKNYTFEIMYSQADCQKYERPTAPGSWCITYGEGHYNYYVRHLGIHYVIFRQDGWENIQRPKNPLSEPGFTREKPHDAYGNSLIALLQSNKSPEPVYITSRWNHGREVTCEADHAYSKEEFQQITGVTDEDLKRIYDIWKANKPSSNHGDNGSAKTREENKLAVRDLKYLQMRINAGENPNVLLYKRAVLVGNDDSKIQNCIAVCKVQPEGDNDRRPVLGFAFLVDRGKIVYETLIKNGFQTFSTKNGLLALNMRNYEKTNSYLYDTKLHRLVDVGGVVKFLSVPYFYDYENCRYFTVNRSARDFALIDSVTKKPVQLPNGEYWANTIKTKSWDWRANRGKDGARTLPDNCVICIIYDESSGEKYYFDTSNNKFLQLNGLEEFGVDVSDPKNTVLNETAGNYVTLNVRTDSNYLNAAVLFNRATNKIIDFGLKVLCTRINYVGDNNGLFICRTPENTTVIGDAENNELLKYKNGEVIEVHNNDYETNIVDGRKYLMFVVNDNYAKNAEGVTEIVFVRILDIQTRTFLNNPYQTETDPTLFRVRNFSPWRIHVFGSYSLFNIVTDPKENQNNPHIIEHVPLRDLIDKQNNNGNEL